MLLLNRVKLIFLCSIVILFLACSTNHLSVSDEKWSCKKENITRHCTVTFKVSNSSHFPVAANIVIRAHKRSFARDSDAMTNEVVFEKKITKTISPNVDIEFNENIKINGKFTHIVMSAWGDEI